MRESCAYPEACEHPGVKLALIYNHSLLTIAERNSTINQLRTELAAVRESFQGETLRTSMLATLLLEYAEIYSVDHFQEPWPKACDRCDLLRKTHQALELPVNTAWKDSQALQQQLADMQRQLAESKQFITALRGELVQANERPAEAQARVRDGEAMRA